MGIDNPLHIAFLLVLLLLVFGARRLPEMGRSLGTGLRGFKDALGGEITQPLLSAQQSGPVATAVPDAAGTPVSASSATPTVVASGASTTPAGSDQEPVV